ncbi:nuclear pore complex component-domain-containing protein [Podospora fimiseda]|uniref:Nuclear pore complex component-domain-containing protein n=1 Tax=Podospora fimiseda TaxID=252190 RepID=A0AAN7BPF6_9PEZI|nr:nuclear pore complex component-domain-containing protein [Podospora fimiseda]
MATPVKQVAKANVSVKESPGNWKHPKLAEITRRQNKTIFSEKNVVQIAYNLAIIAALQVLRQWLFAWVLGWAPFKSLNSPSLRHFPALLFLIPIVNIIRALLPLVRPKDDLSDIALTPAQRQLLGLPASSAPPTPNSVYSTPPRYSRTPSLAGSPISIKSFTSSPLSNFASPSPLAYSPTKFSGNSPTKFNASTQSQYSPSAAVSPLLQKAVGGGRRPSFGSSSALGASTSSSAFGASTSSSILGASTSSSLFGDGPVTPTPVNGKRSSVALNSKWLYERGRRNSSNNWLHQA